MTDNAFDTTALSFGGGRLKYRAALLLAFCLVFAMGAAGTGAQAQQQDREPSLSDEFVRASEEHGVPQELLRAMGYVNTLWEMPPPSASPYEPDSLHGRGAYGLMQLQQNPDKDTLGRAADLTGLSEEELKNDRAANVRGGAAVLADIAGEKKPSDLDGWFDVVAEYGGGTLYAEEVYKTLQDGASATIQSGEKLELASREGIRSETRLATKAGGQYPGSTYYGNNGNNYTNANRGPAQIDKVVVHVAQGSYSGTLSYFNDAGTCCSSHYTVSRYGAVGQSVYEQDIAYHAGHYPTNKTSIGIEHAGYVGDASSFTDAMYRSSAKLTAYVAKKYGVPLDRGHIIGHNQVPGCPGAGGGESCHTDPGRYWNWDKYMGYVRSYAGGGSTATYTQTVDNASPRFTASGRWISSTYHQAQSYGSNHKALKTPLSFADNAKFKIKTPARDTYTVYAQWPADPNYNYSTTFLVQGVNGWNREVRTQRTNGGKWVSLGNYTFPSGDANRVQVSSMSSGNGFIVADAVRIVRR